MRTTRPGESLLLLLGVLNLFDNRKIAYAVTGPLPRLPIAQFASMDVDRILSAARRESLTVEQDFQAAGFHTQLTRGDFEDPVPGLLRISDVYGNQVDLLLGLRGLESTAFSRLVEAPFHGRMVRFIGREDFMARKAFAGRPLHLIDAARAIWAARASLDIALARRLAAQCGRQRSQALDRLLANEVERKVQSLAFEHAAKRLSPQLPTWTYLEPCKREHCWFRA